MKRINSKIEVLCQSEMEMIHSQSLRLLEQVGMKVPNDEILDLCHGLGCIVDKKEQLLKIPATLIESTIAKNKKKRDKEDLTQKKEMKN